MFPTLFKHEVMCVISCVRISLVIGFGLAEDVIFFRYFFFSHDFWVKYVLAVTLSTSWTTFWVTKVVPTVGCVRACVRACVCV